MDLVAAWSGYNNWNLLSIILTISIIWFFAFAMPALSLWWYNTFIGGRPFSPKRTEPLSTKAKIKSCIKTWLGFVLLSSLLIHAAYLRESRGYPEPNSIHEAAYEGNIEAVKQHIAQEVDVNAKGKRGKTSLHRAANKGHKEVVELLISNGADVNAKNDNGMTPLDSAINYPEIKHLLRKHGAKSYFELWEEDN